jgi:hypothetical protein
MVSRRRRVWLLAWCVTAAVALASVGDRSLSMRIPYFTPTLLGEDPEGRDRSAPIVPRRRVASPAQRDTILTLESLHGSANVRRAVSFRVHPDLRLRRIGDCQAGRLALPGLPLRFQGRTCCVQEWTSRRAESICRALGNDGGKGARGLWKTTCPPQSRYQNL